MLQVKHIWYMMGLWYQCRYGWYFIVNGWVGRISLCGYAINILYDRILCSQVSNPRSWYSNVYEDLIRWKHGRIIQGYGWWKSKSNEKGHIWDYFKEVSCWSQCASRNMVFKYKRKPDWKTSNFKAQYWVRGDVQKILSPEPLNLYSPVVQWATVRLMFILHCIIGLQS